MQQLPVIFQLGISLVFFRKPPEYFTAREQVPGPNADHRQPSFTYRKKSHTVGRPSFYIFHMVPA
jgi:hypothetical protein